MADTPSMGGGGGGGANKKRNRKKKKKQGGPTSGQEGEGGGGGGGEGCPISPPSPPPPAPPNPIEVLKAKIEEAKQMKDHKKAHQLREQLWVLQDTVTLGQAGPNAPELDLTLFQSQPQSHSTGKSSTGSTGMSTGAAGVPMPMSSLEKRLSKLKKKLQQVTELKERQARGETLEKNQIAKISTESSITDEIFEVEDLIEAENQLR